MLQIISCSKWPDFANIFFSFQSKISIKIWFSIWTTIKRLALAWFDHLSFDSNEMFDRQSNFNSYYGHFVVLMATIKMKWYEMKWTEFKSHRNVPISLCRMRTINFTTCNCYSQNIIIICLIHFDLNLFHSIPFHLFQGNSFLFIQTPPTGRFDVIFMLFDLFALRFQFSLILNPCIIQMYIHADCRWKASLCLALTFVEFWNVYIIQEKERKKRTETYSRSYCDGITRNRVTDWFTKCIRILLLDECDLQLQAKSELS